MILVLSHVLCLPNCLVFASRTGYLQVYNPLTSDLIASEQGHKGKITSLTFKHLLLFSSGEDKTINIWKIGVSSLNLVHTLTYHQAAINCLQAYETFLISGSEDKTIRVWNRNNKEIKVWDDHTSEIQCLKSIGPILLSADSKGCIKIRDLETGTTIRTYQIQALTIDSHLSDIEWNSHHLIVITRKVKIYF